MTESSNAIIIDLFAPNVPGSIKDKDLIQKELRDQLVDDIRKSFGHESKKANSSDVVKFIDESGRNVFFVDGTRGAGKTTFVNSVVERLNKDKEGSKIECLPTIDPTKLPRHEPILVTVIARLNKIVSDILKSDWSSVDYKIKKDQWQNHLERIKRGLHLLTDKEYKPEYFSDALNLDAQLDYSIGGQNLGQIFSGLIDCACEILSCTAILISFDDIDTQFGVGWDVLEAIRKFFTSDRVVVVMTGDLRLYSQIVRGMQYGNYNSVALSEEDSSFHVKERAQMVEHLEQQYLLKMLPARKRVRLRTLLELESDGSYEIYVASDSRMSSNKNLPIGDVVEKMLKDSIHLRIGTDLDLYVDEFLKQPVRLVIQVLQDYYVGCIEGGAPSSVLANSLYNVFLGSLYRNGFGSDGYVYDIDDLCLDLLSYVEVDQDFNTGFYLRPKSEIASLRQAALYLSSQASRLCEAGLYNSAKFMFSGCGSISIYRQYFSAGDVELSDYSSYLAVGRKEGVSHWSSRLCAALPVNRRSIYQLGGIRLSRSDLNSAVSKTRRFSKVVLSCSISSVSGEQLSNYISIFNIIGVACDVSSEKDRSSVKALLRKESAIKSCIAPNWMLKDGRGAVRPKPDLEYDSGRVFVDKYSSVVYAWVSHINDPSYVIAPSSVLLGKSWVRFFFNLQRIFELAVSGSGNGAGQRYSYMQLCMVAFLHAVFVEEDLVGSGSDSAILGDSISQNPVRSISEFVSKLSRAVARVSRRSGSWRSNYPLFYSLVSCPLFHPFLFGGLGRQDYRDESNQLRILISKILRESGLDILNDDSYFGEIYLDEFPNMPNDG